MHRNYSDFFSGLYFIYDILVIIFAYYISHILRFEGINNSYTDAINVLVLLFVWIVVSKGMNFYEIHRTKQWDYKFSKIFSTIFLYFGVLTVLIFSFKLVTTSRLQIVYFVTILLLMIFFGHLLINYFIVKNQLRDSNLRRLLIIGAGRVGLKLFETISYHPEFGYNLIGFLDDNLEIDVLSSQVIGNIDDIEIIAKQYKIHEVIIAFPIRLEDKVRKVLNTCEYMGIRVRLIPDIYRISKSKLQLGSFAEIPIISVHPSPLENLVNKVLKRAFDIIFSLGVIICISPIFIFTALINKIFYPGPVLFIQKRTGYNQKEFNCYKFRSMKVQAREIADKVQAVQNDPRITKFGQFIRKTNIDELPQFFNVLKGNMSVVGPRPHMVSQNGEFKEAEKQYMTRHLIKPGITGWAQINGWRGPTDTQEKIQKRVEFDIWYMENWNFWLDIQIIVMTILSKKSRLNAF